MDMAIELENALITTCYALPPLLLAGLGGMITSKVGVLNLGLEGMMLIGAFVAVVTNYYTGSSIIGLLVAIIVCSFMGYIFAVFNIKFKVNNIIISVGINMFAIAITKYLLSVMFNVSGAFSSEKIIKMPIVSLPVIDNIPILKVLNNLPIVFWLSLIITFIMSFIINKTSLGLRIRATGLNDVAVNTAGVNPSRIRYMCIMFSGALCGMAGAYLSTSHLAMFTNGMTAGRGFLGNIASIMGNRTAGGTLFGTLIFSVTNGFTMKIQTFGFPSQLIQLIPYIVAFMVVIIAAILKNKKENIKVKTT